MREHAKIEAGRLEDVSLKPSGENRWDYAGPWFQLESTAGEDATRRVVVRLEQIFTAYRRLAPPRAQDAAPRPLRVRVFGSTEEYDQFLADLGARLRNPSVFIPRRNLLAVGGDLRRLWTELAAAQKQSHRLEEQLADKRREIPERRRKEAAELKRAGARPTKSATICGA